MNRVPLGVLLAFPSVVLAGCALSGVALNPRTDDLAPERSNPASAMPAEAKARELPPAKAAQACWLTAEEMRRKPGLEADAIAEYEKVRSLDPRYPRVAWRLAVLYDKQGNGARATIEYQRALRAEPRNADLLNDLGYYHYQRQSYTEAEKWLRQSVAINPKHERAWVNLGLTLGHQGKAEESLECFTRALPSAQAHCNVGVLLANHDRKDDARHYFTEALRLDPTLAQAKTFLSWLDGPPARPDAIGGNSPHQPASPQS